MPGAEGAPPAVDPFQEALEALSAALARVKAMDDVVATILDHGILVTGAYAGGVAALVDDGRAFDVLGTVGYTPGVLREVLRIPRSAALPICEVADVGRPVYLESLAAWRARYAIDPLALGGRPDGAWAALPLASSEGTCLGVLTLSFLEPRTFSSVERARLAQLADRCAQALAPFLDAAGERAAATARLDDAAQGGAAEHDEAHRARATLAETTPATAPTGADEPSADRPAGGARDLARPSAADAEVRAALELMPQLVWTTTPDGYHDYYNARWYAYTGMPRPDDPSASAEGWNWKNYLHPDDYERAVARWAHSLATGESYEIEYRFREAATGGYRWFLGRAEPQRDHEGRIVRWFGTCTDIEDAAQLTATVRAQHQALLAERQALETANAQLRAQTSAIEAQARLVADQAVRLEAKAREAETARLATERILSAVADGVLGVDADGRITFANAAATRLLGYDGDASALVGRSLDHHVNRRVRQDRLVQQERRRNQADIRAASPLARALASGKPVHGVHDTFSDRDGRSLPVRYAVHPIAEGGAITGAVVTFADVSAQLAAEADRLRLAGDASRARERAEVAEARLAEVFRQAPAFIAVLHGPEHRFTFVNEKYAELVGGRDVIGRTVREALPEVAGQGFFEILDRVLATGESFVGTEMPIYLRTAAAGDGADGAEAPPVGAPPVGAAPTGAASANEAFAGEPSDAADAGPAAAAARSPIGLRYLTFIYQALVESGGARSGVFVHGVDVTEQVQARHMAEAERVRAEAAREAAHAANVAKAQFLATMSHELRTPLNAISGYVQLLSMGLHGPVSDGQQDALTRIDRAQRHLLTIINDILNYAKLEAGRVEFRRQPVSLADLATAVHPLIAPQLEAKALRYVVDVRGDDPAHPGAPLHAWADREKLTQVVLNLLSNAVKFTPDGGEIALELDVADAGAPKEAADADAHTGGDGDAPGRTRWLRLHVRDTGPGIAADKLEAIFDPFVQVHGDRGAFARAFEGTGLGLAISRDLARGMGGDLTVTSVVGVGTTFTLSLRAVEDASRSHQDSTDATG